MRRVAEDVFQIALTPRDGINAYLLGDVVVDAGAKVNAPRLIKALHGHAVGAHALTHAHPDHAGGPPPPAPTAPPRGGARVSRGASARGGGAGGRAGGAGRAGPPPAPETW